MLEDILEALLIFKKYDRYCSVFLKVEGEYGFIGIEYNSLNIDQCAEDELKSFGWSKYGNFFAYPLLMENE